MLFRGFDDDDFQTSVGHGVLTSPACLCRAARVSCMRFAQYHREASIDEDATSRGVL